MTMPSGARRRVEHPRGFTLVEVLVSSFILAVVLIALSSLFALGLKTQAVSKEETVMAALAQEKLEHLRRLPRQSLELLFDSDCQGPCSGTCGHPCYPSGCSNSGTELRVVDQHEDPVSDPNPTDRIRESMYVRQWLVEKVNLGQPVGCVYKVTVNVGSRNGLFAPVPASPEPSSWLQASWQYVVGVNNPRRVVVATYRR